MRLLVAILLSIAPATAGAVSLEGPQLAKPAPTSTDGCRRIIPYYAYREGRPLKPHNLNELPPAHAFSAVFRQIGGCEAPIVIKYSIGGR
jgi:hypothetical protein